jgi:hypothetical protein
VDLPLAISADAKGVAVLLFTGVVAPLAGLVFHRVGGGRETIGKGPFAMERELPTPPRRQAADPAVPHPSQDAELRAEVRQLVVARNERRMRNGATPLDVEAETDRQLADFIESGG